MARYFELDEKRTKVLRKLVKRHPKQFGHIDPEHVVAIVDKDSDRARAYADCSLVPLRITPLTPYQIVITIYECNYRRMDRNAKILCLFHELLHVAEGPSGYKLRRHDLEDFKALVEVFGPNWPQRKDLPNFLKEDTRVTLKLESMD